MKRWFISLVLISLLVTSTMMVAVAQEPTEQLTEQATEEPTVEVTPMEEPTPTEEPTEEPTVEATEEPTVEPTEEPTEEPTVEPTEEPTEEPTVEPTEEPTEEPTLEPTEEPTVEPTVTPTFTATVEITATATMTPALGTQGEIGAQAYSGQWNSTVAVQNIGTGDAHDVTIRWYKNGEASFCDDTVDPVALKAGASRFYSPPTTGTCGTSWIGSAVVSSADQPLAAMVETVGSAGNLLADYVGESLPSTEPWIFPGPYYSVKWNPIIIGISNAGNDTAEVRVSLFQYDGTFSAAKDVSIPSQSGVQLNLQQDILSDPSWAGSIRIENRAGFTPQPLYAAFKTERVWGGVYPVTTSYGGFRATSDASNEWVVTLANRSVTAVGSTLARGMNTQMAINNTSSSISATVVISWFNRDGTLQKVTEFPEVPPNGVVNPFAALYTGLLIPGKTTWGGTAVINAYVQGTTNPHPVVAIVQPTYKVSDYFNTWGSFKPFVRSEAKNTFYAPSARRNYVTGVGRTGAGWCTVINVANLSTTGLTTVRVEFYDETTGALVYTAPDYDLAVNGSWNWLTCHPDMDAVLGDNWTGAAKVTVVGGSGPIGGIVQHHLQGYPNTDAFGYYNPIPSD